MRSILYVDVLERRMTEVDEIININIVEFQNVQNINV